MGLALRAARAAGAAGDVPIGAALVAGDGTVLAVVGNEREDLGVGGGVCLLYTSDAADDQSTV